MSSGPKSFDILWLMMSLLTNSVMGQPIDLSRDSSNFTLLDTVPEVQTGHLPCPNPDAIAPCTCTYDKNYNMELDCSRVDSEEELKTILNQEFPFPNIQKFILDGSNIKAIREGDLGQLSFTYVFITSSHITYIEESAFYNSYDSLSYLTISNCYLSTAPDISLFKVLRVLDMSGNGLTAFPKLNSASLLQLLIGKDPIREIPMGVLEGVPNLELLRCEYCEISEIKPGAFTGLDQLDQITLNDNLLTAVASGTFLFSRLGGALDLQNNQISSLEHGSIEGATAVLNLANNLLTELDENMFRPVLEANGELYIEENPFKCGCDIAWLVLDPTLLDRLTDNPKCFDGYTFKELDPTIIKSYCG